MKICALRLKEFVAKAFLLVLAATILPMAAGAAPGQGQSWKFAVTDDSRAGGSAYWGSNGVSTVVLGAIANDIVKQGVDFVLFPGDMITGEINDSAELSKQLDKWVATMQPVYQAGIPLYVTRGGHEYNPLVHSAANPADPSRETFLAHFDMPKNGPDGEKGLTWSFTHKNAKVVGFDTYANRTDKFDDRLFAPGSNKGQMMNPWVIDEIKKFPAEVNFVIAHEQMWATISHFDTFANDPDSRDALAAVLATHNGTYFAGHDHMYVRGFLQKNNGLRTPIFTVGTAGAGNYDYNFLDVFRAGYPGPYEFVGQMSLAHAAKPVFGYLLVTVNPDGTWSGEFRGSVPPGWGTADTTMPPFTTMDSFTSTGMLNWP
ncbi:MAG: metallophosphoesterase family protein [Myxococcales bacterium]